MRQSTHRVRHNPSRRDQADNEARFHQDGCYLACTRELLSIASGVWEASPSSKSAEFSCVILSMEPASAEASSSALQCLSLVLKQREICPLLVAVALAALQTGNLRNSLCSLRTVPGGISFCDSTHYSTNHNSVANIFKRFEAPF